MLTNSGLSYPVNGIVGARPGRPGGSRYPEETGVRLTMRLCLAVTLSAAEYNAKFLHVGLKPALCNKRFTDNSQ